MFQSLNIEQSDERVKINNRSSSQDNQNLPSVINLNHTIIATGKKPTLRNIVKTDENLKDARDGNEPKM